MHILRNLILIFIFSVLLIFTDAISQDTQLLIDPTELNLEIIKTEVVDHISNFLQTRTVTPNRGQKLVIVTLKGTITDTCNVLMSSLDFTAIYEKESTKYSVRLASAFQGAGIDEWIILPPEEGTMTGKFYFEDPDSVIFKAAFILPDKISSFFVRYAKLAKGKASISGKKGEPKK